MIPGLPKDANRESVPLMPPKIAIEETYDATISASTEITLNVATTLIEVTVLDKPVFMKWGTTDASSTDWDHLLPSNSITAWEVPTDSATGVCYTAVNFIEQAATAAIGVAEF